MHSRHAGPGNRFYRAYRKIRYLAHTGSLFYARRTPDIKTDNPGKGTFIRIALNSTFLFLIAYLLIYSVHLLATGYAALAFDIPVVVYHYDVDFLIRGIDWTPDSVTGVFSSSPLVILILTLLLLILFKSVETETGMGRLLILWMIFAGSTRVLGEIMIGAVMGKGFGFVMAYLFVMDTGKVIFTLLGAVGLIATGLALTRRSLYTANTYFNDLLVSYRNRFVISQFIVPFILGNLVIVLVRTPETNYFELFLNASMILILVPIMIRSVKFEDLYFDLDKRHPRISMVTVVTAIILLAAFRILFGFGLRL